MKVGIDSILLGSWVNVEFANNILDVGTGCGILSLMCAQRNQNAIIEGIDVHSESVEEANENFFNSPWSNRLSAKVRSYNDVIEKKYDLIISNPPFFNSGIERIVNPRECARHQSSLSPTSLLSKGKDILVENGVIGLIFPFCQFKEVVEMAELNRMHLIRAAKIKGRRELEFKRIMMEFQMGENLNFEPVWKEIVLEDLPGSPSEEFKRLCKNFYLKF
ncbi:MAG: methyltransferase [Bacteroides sp.]|nr:methyltransferase [Bacteroides sp.]